MSEKPNTYDEWIVRFINSPHQDQLEFLYRLSLEQEVREKVERKILGTEYPGDE